MSASREKKQRQAADPKSLSPRAQEELKKQQRRKRNTIIYTVIGVVAAILVAALLIWSSGFFQRRATAATIGGEKVTPTQVLYYYYNNSLILEAQAYAQYGLVYPYYSLSLSPKDQVIDADTAADLGLDEKYIDQTFHDYFLDSALDSLQQECALRAAAKAAGYTLSDAGKDNVQAQLEQLDSYRAQILASNGNNLSRTAYLQLTYGNLMNESAYRTCLENRQLASEYYMQGADTLFNFSDAELESYYEDNQDTLDTFSYYYRIFNGTASGTTDAEGNYVAPTEEEQAAALAEAEADANAALADVLADFDSVKDNDDYTLNSSVLSPSTSSYYDWLTDSSRKVGDAAVLNVTSTSFHVVVFAGRELDQSPTADVRHILISAIPEDDPATEDVDESTQEPTQADYDAAKAEAERIKAEWEAGGATEEGFAALAEQYSVDTGSNTNGGLYRQVYEGQMITEFNDWVFASGRKSGDVGFAQNTESVSNKGWHLIYYVGDNLPVWKITAGEALWIDSLDTTFEIVRKGGLNSLGD